MAQGLAPAVLQDAAALGATPGSTAETVSFILRGRNLFRLESPVEEGKSADLTVAQFASRYGQTPAAITALESYLNGYGISTSAYPDDLDVTANGTAAQFNSALSVQRCPCSSSTRSRRYRLATARPPSRPSRCTVPKVTRPCPPASAPACWPSSG